MEKENGPSVGGFGGFVVETFQGCDLSDLVTFGGDGGHSWGEEGGLLIGVDGASLAGLVEFSRVNKGRHQDNFRYLQGW